MTAEALRESIKKAVQEKLDLQEQEIRIMDGPEAMLAPGLLFFSIHPGPIQAPDINYGLDEYYSVSITISIKGTRFQMNRWLEGAAGGFGILTSAFEKFRNKLIFIHKNYEPILKVANESLVGQSPFIEPLRFESADVPRRRGGDWWGDSVSKAPCGMSQTLTFVGARRIRSIEELQ